MSDEPLFNDTLPFALQNIADKKLLLDETVLMTLAGASGEGLVVSDRRVMILREQMPIVGAETEVDCFDHSFEQIRAACVEDAPGGGRLKLVLFAPPATDDQTTLFFPAYSLDRFEAAAARIRLLAMPHNLPSDSDQQPSSGSSSICGRCGATVTCHAIFCSACGAPQGKTCGGCGAMVREGDSFCPTCGVSAVMARVPVCGSCGQTVAPHHAFCTGCGKAQGAVCPSCGRVAAAGWACCAACGHSLAPTGLVALKSDADEGPPLSAAVDAPADLTADERNRRGMRLYEEKRFDQAAAEFKAALDLAPGTSLYHCHLGVALAEMGRDLDALEEYETAIRLAPYDPTAYLNLGYFYAARGDGEAARIYWTKAIDIAPDSPEAQEARRNLVEAASD